MNETQPPRLGDVLLCPDCHTLLLGEADACAHCQLDLQWTRRAGQFRNALHTWATACEPEVVAPGVAGAGDAVELPQAAASTRLAIANPPILVRIDDLLQVS